MKEQEIRMALAGKLREFRKRAGLTAKEVGEKIGKSDKTVSGWEHGRGQPDADTLFKLCEIYNVGSISAFYTNAQDNTEAHTMDLSADEEELLNLYRSLNLETRAILLNSARGFAGNPDMRKEDTKSETA